MEAWLGRNPYTVVADEKREPGKILLNWKVIEDLRDYFPALIGDCVHNLRCALDHLAWALVERNGNTPNDRTEFLITYNSETFDKNVASRLAGASDEAIQAVKERGFFNPVRRPARQAFASVTTARGPSRFHPQEHTLHDPIPGFLWRDAEPTRHETRHGIYGTANPTIGGINRSPVTLARTTSKSKSAMNGQGRS